MDISLGDTGKKVGNFIGRYHYIIFFVLVIGGLSVAIITLSTTVSTPDTTDYTSSINDTSLDEATLGELRALERPENDQPSGRINPF